MKLTQLKYFVTIVERGGFVAASRELNIAQPALSRQINDLEYEVGTKLLERSNRGTDLTTPGRGFYNRARAILEQIEVAKYEALNQVSEPVGEVRVAMPTTAAGQIAPKLVHLVAEKFPQVTISIIDGLGHESAHVIETGRVDFGLIPNAMEIPNAETTPIFEEYLFLVSQRKGKTPNDKPISMKQLERIRLVTTGRQVHLRRYFESAAAKAGCSLNVAYEQQTVSTILSFVREGLASSVLNWPAVLDYWEAGLIDAQRIIRPELSRTLSLAIPKSRPLTIAAGAVYPLFKSLLLDEVKSDQWKGRLL